MKDLERRGLKPARAVFNYDNELRAGAGRSSLVQHRSPVDARHAARTRGGAVGFSSAVPELSCCRRAPGAKDPRDICSERRHRDRHAYDVRASRCLQRAGVEGFHPGISLEISDRLGSAESRLTDTAHHGALQNARHTQPGALVARTVTSCTFPVSDTVNSRSTQPSIFLFCALMG